MTPAQRLVIRTQGDLVIVGFADPSILDTVQIEQIGKELHELVEQRRAPKVLLDFSTVKFLSSSAIGELLTLRRRCDERHGRLAICALRAELLRVLQVTRLDVLFEFFPDVASAAKAMAQHG